MKPDKRVEKATIEYLQRKDMEDLLKLVENGTSHITIETPEGWRCEREGCRIDYLHSHGTYPSLKQYGR